MAKNALPLFLAILLLATSSTSHSFFYQYTTLVSLSHSLITRVANLRDQRGDLEGSNRARVIAQWLEPGLGSGFSKTVWSFGWDYAKNHEWKDFDYKKLNGSVSDANELLRSLGELTRAVSEGQSSAWSERNYQNSIAVSKRLLDRFLYAFPQTESLRELVETVQIEVVEGGLLRDCLEIGSSDLKVLLAIIKGLASQFSTSSGAFERIGGGGANRGGGGWLVKGLP